MEGTISTDILERHHLLLKTNSILIFAGSIEIDDYKSKELNRRMYKMKVGSVTSLESQMSQGNKSILIDVRNLPNDSIQSNMANLKSLNGDFWKHGNCKIHLKILHDNSEAIIELGDEFKLMPSPENIKILKDMFGDQAIKLNK
jgi:DNA polymerase-3 subunit alpha